MNATRALAVPANRRLGLGSVLVLGLALTVAGLLSDLAYGSAGLLVAAVFGMQIALGGAILIALCAVTRAGWWQPIRRVPLLVARTLPVPVAFLAVAFALGLHALYPWARPEVVHGNHLLEGKAVWLNVPFFLGRAALVIAVWLLLIANLRARIDESVARFTRTGAIFLLLLAPTISIASWDWTMSLEPEWFSTMWAVYGFSGAFLAGVAAVILVALFLERRGRLTLTPGIRHDLGKILFAFASFWAYIWYCQYMLIWYANLPEETVWFEARTTGGWSILFWVNPILNWAIPFVVLLSARAKRDPSILAQAAACVIAGRWLDSYMMVTPALGPSPGVPLFAVGAAAALLAAMWLLLEHLLRSEPALG